jgi:hypothetical protein
MTIRCIYSEAPKFPATDQHPDAVRYQVAGYWVDAIGGEPTPEEVDAVVSPPAAPHLNNGGLARFSGTAPATMSADSIRMSGVTRVAKGRYRVTHEVAMPSDQYSVIASIFDANPRNVRVTARTASYVEVRVTDNANAAQDAAEITVKTERVVTPS